MEGPPRFGPCSVPGCLCEQDGCRACESGSVVKNTRPKLGCATSPETQHHCEHLSSGDAAFRLEPSASGR
eukprot:2105166-Rhodomonas_salina.3